jgi:hypothetical protein
VNLGKDVGTQRIVVYEGDTAEGLAHRFSTEYNLDDEMKQKLTAMLNDQINGVLGRIEEEDQSNTSDLQSQE